MNKSIWRERIETIIVVTIITALVWLYAEGESVRTYQETVRIEFVSGAGHDFRITPGVPTDSQNAIDVHITFRSSAGQHQEFRQKTNHSVIQIPIIKSGEQAVVIKQALANNPPINQLGLSIQQTNPSTVTLNVQPIAKVQLPVRVQTLGINLDKPATADPAQVTLKLPKKYSKRVTGEYVIASLSALRAQNFSKGKHTRKVKVTLPYYLRWLSDKIEIEPDSVSIDFSIAGNTGNLTLYNLPVRIDAAPQILDQYKFTFPDGDVIYKKIKLVGSDDAIKAIRSGRTSIWAEIHPIEGAIQTGTNEMQLYAHTPNGVKLITNLPKIKVKVEKRVIN